MIPPEKFLLLVSSTLFLSYVSGLVYTKTKIPDILWLLGFGTVLGPILGIFEKESFVSVSPLMGVIAICIITFNSGIGLDFRILQKTFLKSVALTLTTFFAIVILIGLAISFIAPGSFGLIEGMLLGSMVAGISTVAVTSLMDGLSRLFPNMESSRALLMLESTLCDPIRMVAAITLIRMIMLPGVSIRDSARDIVFTFVMGSFIGLVISMFWAEVRNRLMGEPFNNMITLAALFPTYFLAENLAGDGAGTMAVFVFGLVLANYKQVAKGLKINKSLRTDKQSLIDFNEEIIFLLKSYYFVYIGLIVILSTKYFLIGLGLVMILIAIRYVIASAIGKFMGFTIEEKVISRIVYTLGTSTLVMSQLPLIFDPKMNFITNPEIYPDLCFPIVIGTLIFSSVVSPIIAKRQLEAEGPSAYN
ncbi:MAG: cation:proton antiporter [Candidatus Bathyarchaeota archaeon]|nr:cation:proton antiporter [Candidatus Bathyarchaeota archaeon]